MNLLLLDQFSQPGGAQQCLLELLPAIRRRGWKSLVGLPGEGPLFARIRELGLDSARIDCGPYSSGTKSMADVARFAAETPKLARQIRSLVGDFNADLVYLNGPRLIPAAAWANLRCPVVFHAHSFLFPGAIRTFTGFSLRRLKAWVIAACRFVAEPWTRYVPAERRSVIYNGVAGPPVVAGSERAGPWVGQPQVGPPPVGPQRVGPQRVGCLGRIAPEKGQREFLAAAAIIHRAVPDCRFVIYGAPLFSGSQYAGEVRAAATGLPVEFAGWVQDVYPALAELDLVLVPSAGHEGTTRVIPEAFAAGVPVVAFRSGGIPEILDQGYGGWLAGNVEEMARTAIEFLTAGQAARARASEAARENWRRRFTLERYHRELLDSLDRIATSASTERWRTGSLTRQCEQPDKTE
ncbi:MAG TPA: glycosyltransferase family 4 protein [Candidatus Acidoferrales bacterium]|nr:glycosyltransferase family 4 protein [Candidatus Acidoferrales bacterium]